MKSKKLTSYFILLAIMLFSINCSSQDIHEEIKEEKQTTYSLTVLPDKLSFPAAGGEISPVISAKKTVTTFIGSTIKSIYKTDAQYTVTVSGEGFDWTGTNVIAEVNKGVLRTGTLNVSIDNTAESKTIQIEQKASSNPQEPDIEEPGQKNLKILAIGNSFSVDAVEQYLYEIADSKGDKFTIGNLFLGSASLQTHSNNAKNNESAYSYRKIVNGVRTVNAGYSIKKGLEDEVWDIISIQQVSTYAGFPETFDPYIDELISYIKNNTTNTDLEIGYHMAWAAGDLSGSQYSRYNNDQITMYNKIVEVTQEKAAPKVDFVIPSGSAIQNGRTVLGNSYTRDALHLELYFGRYTAALTWYEKLTGRSVIDIKYVPVNVTQLQSKVAQHGAHFAVEKPYEISSLTFLTKD